MADRFITVESDGVEYTINALDIEDPTENMLRTLEALESGFAPAMFDLVRLLGVDTTGWRMSQVRGFFDAVKAQVEMEPGESSGSGTSSGATAKKPKSS